MGMAEVERNFVGSVTEVAVRVTVLAVVGEV